MALPPTSAPAPAAAAGADPAMAGGAPADDMGADESASPPVLFTVMASSPSGPYVLMSGDEPEGEGSAAADAPKLATPQELMKAIMTLLSPDAGAEDSFAKGFKGEPDDTASGQPAGM